MRRQSVCSWAVSWRARGIDCKTMTRRPAAYIAMASEVLEELDLTQGALGQDLLAEDIGDLLDGDALVALVVDGCAIRTHEEPLADGLPMNMSPAA